MATMATFTFRMVEQFQKIFALFLAHLSDKSFLIDLVGGDHVEKLAAVEAGVCLG